MSERSLWFSLKTDRRILHHQVGTCGFLSQLGPNLRVISIQRQKRTKPTQCSAELEPGLQTPRSRSSLTHSRFTVTCQWVSRTRSGSQLDTTTTSSFHCTHVKVMQREDNNKAIYEAVLNHLEIPQTVKHTATKILNADLRRLMLARLIFQQLAPCC